MNRTIYETYTNLSRDKYFDGYKDGDQLVFGFRGEVDEARADMVPLHVFARHNQDDRPDGAWAPSLSVGDVVRVLVDDKWTAYSVDRMDFTEIEFPEDPALVEREALWKEVVAR